MYKVLPGIPHPLGATPDRNGVNFVIYSQHASSVELLLFDTKNSPEPVQIIPLDPQQHLTFHFWHAYIPGLRAGMHYAYRLDGPPDLHREGDRFLPKKVVIDPYSKGNSASLWKRGDAVVMAIT